MNETASCNDAAFGPAVEGCRDNFDFTLAFEQYIFTLVPAIIFLFAAPVRIASLRKTAARVEGQVLRVAKLTAIAVFACLQLALLVLCATQPIVQGSRTSALAASSLSLAAALALLPLSYLEHARSLRPSLIASGYLTISALLDAAILRTLWISTAEPGTNSVPTDDTTNPTICNVCTASFALKLVVLVLEAASKRRFFLEAYRNRSPEESSGLFGQGLLLWLNGVVFYGARHLLKPASLYPIAEDMKSEKVGDDFWELWTKAQVRQHKDSSKNPSLNRTLFKLLAVPVLLPAIPRLALLGLTLCQPLMLRRLLAYLEDPVARQDPKIGYALIGATVIIYVGMAITAAVYWHRHYRFLAMLRGTLITSVFRKATLLPAHGPPSAAANAKTVTLMSADCERITRGLLTLHDLWADVSQVAIATWLIERQLGVACVAPIAVTLVTTGLTVYFANMTPGFQMLWVEKVQARIGVTTSVLGAMKAIKITNLTNKTGALLNKLREDELNSARKFRIVSIVTATVATIPQLISPVVTFAVYIAVARRSDGATLHATNMFTSLSLLLLIGEPLFSLFEGMISVMTAIGCLSRVEEFLRSETREEKRVFLHNLERGSGGEQISPSDAPVSSSGDDRGTGCKASVTVFTARDTATAGHKNGIVIQKGQFGWDVETKKPVLTGIELVLPAGSVTMVAGPVGCGKSTLIRAVLGETPVWEGDMVLSHPDVAFCDQTPWIMNDTVRANITYASTFDAELYNTVLRSCDLVSDLAVMEKGDMTLVGSKGFSLSAGQRQRVAIARAVYSRKKIALLDDVFSQLDASTQVMVAQRLLGLEGLWRKWGTTLLMTSSSSEVPMLIYFMLPPRNHKPSWNCANSKWCDHTGQFLSLADQVIALDASGTIVQRGTFAELINVEGYVRDISRSQAQFDEKSSGASAAGTGNMLNADNDPFVAGDSKKAMASTTTSGDAQPDPSHEEAVDGKPPGTENAIYRYYLSSVKKIDLATFLFFQTLVAFLGCFSYVWLKWWTDDSASFPYGTSAYYIGVYAVIQTAAMIATGLSTLWCLNALAVTTGLQLHATLAKTVMSATLQLFSATDSGSIMNRFTQDIQLADIQLPLSVLICVGHFLAVIGQAGLIASASGWIALSYPFLFAVFYFIPSYYVRTARQMRTLDLEEKAPIYAQFLESLSGMTTLRAFAHTHVATSHNHALVDRSQRPWYLMYVIQKWLGVVLDLVIAGLATMVVGLSVGLLDTSSSGSDAGFTGVSLTQIISFTSYLKLLILFWAQLQMCMSAVQRIRSFSENTEAEADHEAVHGASDVTAEWPAHGGIVVKSLSTKYRPEDTEFVLKDINLDIKPGEKVCIVGRTGSGKSSLVLALFRLLEPSTGSIAIDDIDITHISRSTLRSRIVGIAEEPFFLPGSVRENMTPWADDGSNASTNTNTTVTEHADDASLIAALEDVELWHGDGKLESRGGLDAVMDPDALSMGQKQLFNISRAVMRGGRVVVMDEVTSSLDVQSERVVKTLIENRLASRTVVAVIHKLAFASGFDRVAVMHEGRIVEFDTPANLLAKEGGGSRFRELCEAQRLGGLQGSESGL